MYQPLGTKETSNVFKVCSIYKGPDRAKPIQRETI